MLHDLKRNTKHCKKDLGENLKCLCSDVGNALKSGNSFSRAEHLRCEVECLRGGRNGEREGGRRLPIMLTTPKYYNLNFFCR